MTAERIVMLALVCMMARSARAYILVSREIARHRKEKTVEQFFLDWYQYLWDKGEREACECGLGLPPNYQGRANNKGAGCE